jgi:hypothetical protein
MNAGSVAKTLSYDLLYDGEFVDVIPLKVPALTQFQVLYLNSLRSAVLPEIGALRNHTLQPRAQVATACSCHGETRATVSPSRGIAMPY